MRQFDPASPSLQNLQSKNLQKAPSENLFFFTDNDYFRSQRFEYLSPEAARKSFVFGLFVTDLVQNNTITMDTFTSAMTINTLDGEQTSLDPMEHLSQIQNFR